MDNRLGEFIKNKINIVIENNNKKKSEIIRELSITTQYLNDIENGKRIPSAKLMKRMIKVLGFDGKETIELYDLASECHKDKKVPADIEEFILNNKNAKDKIRALMNEMEVK